MILYIENPKDATKKWLDSINEFGKVAGYKINIQKSVAFLYTSNELSEREIKKTITCTIGKKIRYLEISWTKICTQKIIGYWRNKLRKIQITDGSIYHVHELEELTSLKCSYYPDGQ